MTRFLFMINLYYVFIFSHLLTDSQTTKNSIAYKFNNVHY